MSNVNKYNGDYNLSPAYIAKEVTPKIKALEALYYSSSSIGEALLGRVFLKKDYLSKLIKQFKSIQPLNRKVLSDYDMEIECLNKVYKLLIESDDQAKFRINLEICQRYTETTLHKAQDKNKLYKAMSILCAVGIVAFVATCLIAPHLIPITGIALALLCLSMTAIATGMTVGGVKTIEWSAKSRLLNTMLNFFQEEKPWAREEFLTKEKEQINNDHLEMQVFP